MNNSELKTLDALNRLRKLRERRAYDALLRDYLAASRARENVATIESRIDAERIAADQSEDETMSAMIGHAMSVADLSRLQASTAGGHRKVASLTGGLERAQAQQEEAQAILENSRNAYRNGLKAVRKVEAALDETRRKENKRLQAIDELLTEPDGSKGGPT